MSRPGAAEVVQDPLARRARATPDRTAVVDDADGSTRTYGALDDDVAAVAGHLAGLGLAPGDHLGLLADTGVGAVRLVHAAWRQGLRLVPLNARLSRPEVARQADRADLDALVCSPARLPAAADVGCPVHTGGNRDVGAAGGPSGDTPPAGTTANGLADVEPVAPVSPDWRSGDVALMLFTSGTTGSPKLVELTMGNLLASATASAFRLGVAPDDRWLLCLPIYHMGGLAPVLRCAHYGTTLVVQTGFDPAAVARATRERGVTGLSLVPTQLRRVLETGEALGEALRTVLLGGAAAPTSLLERCRQRDVPVHPTYGLTETASQVATATPEQAFAHPGTVGQPLLGVEVTVVDGDGAPRPTGEPGEIVVAGPIVSPGYYDDPGATRRAVDTRGLHTGDRGHVDGTGRLWVSGRLDDRIVTGGENVDPVEVAAALEAHAGVADAAVVGLPDPEWGERVAALVVAAGGEPPDLDDLRAHCRERLAGFKVPRAMAVADAIPRTASGTVDRAAVRDALEG